MPYYNQLHNMNLCKKIKIIYIVHTVHTNLKPHQTVPCGA